MPQKKQFTLSLTVKIFLVAMVLISIGVFANSIMRYNTGGFNAPSREAIYYRIHKLAYGDSWEYDYEEFAEWDAKNRKTSATTRSAQSYKPANYKPTHAPVIIKKTWKDAQ